MELLILVNNVLMHYVFYKLFYYIFIMGIFKNIAGNNNFFFNNILNNWKNSDKILFFRMHKDNRNKAGCTACIIDPGYNCSAVVGQPSICTICGNGIVESN